MLVGYLNAGPRAFSSVTKRGGHGRSVGRGAHRPAIEPRKRACPACRRCPKTGRPYDRERQREHTADPAGSKTLACADASCLGTGRSLARPSARPADWSASGRRGAVADDARTGEVRPRHSSDEAGEQRRATVCGVGGAKGGGRGERGTGPHAPGSARGKRVLRLDRVRQAARQRKTERFTALL